MKKKVKKRIPVLLVCAMLLCTPACQHRLQGADSTKAVSGGETDMAGVTFTEEDLDETWDANAVHVSVSDDGTVADGEGAVIEDNHITVRQAGTYVLSGSLSDGQIIVDADKTSLVHLVLDGADITCKNGPAIYGIQSDKVVITLAEGSDNRLTDGTAYVLEAGEDEPDAALFSRDGLTINGKGKLTVCGNYQDGIRSKDELKMISGTVGVTAVSNAISGKDSVAVKGGSLTVSAGNDGINSKGDVCIQGGEMTLVAGDDGIHADEALTVSDGVIIVEKSYEGLEGLTVEISGGDIGIHAKDDGINAAGGSDSEAVQTKGGNPGAGGPEAGDMEGPPQENDRPEPEGMGEPPQGNKNPEAESMEEPLQGNKSPGAESMEELPRGNGGRQPQQMGELPANAGGSGRDADMFENNEDAWIKISGGTVYIDASGDGIDSNGSFYVTGGMIFVDGPENGGNGALDYAGTAGIEGGIIVAAGSSQMAQNFSEAEGQPSVMLAFSEMQPGGTAVHLADASGSSLLTYVPSKKFQNIIISAPGLSLNESCTVSTGGECSGTPVHGYYGDAPYTGGTVVSQFTVENIRTSISNIQVTVQARAAHLLRGCWRI